MLAKRKNELSFKSFEEWFSEGKCDNCNKYKRLYNDPYICAACEREYDFDFCEKCNKPNRRASHSCDCLVYTGTNNENYLPIPFGEEKRTCLFIRQLSEKEAGKAFKRCPYCFVRKDGFHHHGCPWEECPECGQQIIKCGCIVELQEYCYLKYNNSR